MAGKLMGRAFIRAKGITLASIQGSATLNPGGIERTPVVGDYGLLGYTEKPVPGEIGCDIAIAADTDIVGINKMTDISVTFEADTGQVWIMTEASLASPAEVASGDGKATLKFSGNPVEQV